jgi:hypothetical protein
MYPDSRVDNYVGREPVDCRAFWAFFNPADISDDRMLCGVFAHMATRCYGTAQHTAHGHAWAFGLYFSAATPGISKGLKRATGDEETVHAA